MCPLIHYGTDINQVILGLDVLTLSSSVLIEGIMEYTLSWKFTDVTQQLGWTSVYRLHVAYGWSDNISI